MQGSHDHLPKGKRRLSLSPSGAWDDAEASTRSVTVSQERLIRDLVIQKEQLTEQIRLLRDRLRRFSNKEDSAVHAAIIAAIGRLEETVATMGTNLERGKQNLDGTEPNVQPQRDEFWDQCDDSAELDTSSSLSEVKEDGRELMAVSVSVSKGGIFQQ